MKSLQLAIAATQVLSALALDIDVSSEGGNATSGHQYGFLHEDINNSGDGGIYAELIRNRAFQYSDAFPVSLDGWRPVDDSTLDLTLPEPPLSDVLPYAVQVKGVGLQNEGFWGMDVRPQKYTGSFWVKGAYDGTFTASLRSNLTEDVFGSVEIESKSVDDDWTEHEFELYPDTAAPNSNNTFAITFDPEPVPPTYKNRKNGLRIDIAEALAGLHPSLIRFPGGNMLEGLSSSTWWDWKDTLGPLRYRPGFQGVWGYQQTHGLGIVEYLDWAEDMNLEVVVGVFAGLALNGDITPREEMQPLIDDALDQIEFISGPADSKWGSRRAELGHPDPFPLHYVEIGNEDWLAGGSEGWITYLEYRFPMFLAAINEAYPDITVVSSCASTDGGGWDIPAPAIGDYHPYREPDVLVEEFDRFDNDGPHIVGEVAATHPNGGIGWDGNLMPFPWWMGTVGEAVSLIGYERNADRVPGTFYAPVARNMNRWQWAVTILQFAADPAMTTRSTSWYVWELFARYPMSRTLPATAEFGPAYYVAGVNDDTGSHIWKGAVYNTTDGADLPFNVHFEGVDAGATAQLTLLTNEAGDPYAYNDPYTGVNIVHSETIPLVADENGAFSFSMPQLSVAVLATDTSAEERKVKKRTVGRR
ncbi:alpha-N-arabinofuranosidase A [Stachybotrys elegans]|uniref:non-reducing end alpha-L-arabinofuranosidase n=1 Tax=Stachybotrys elegans TaxID=80388 RepID=A0A8K0WQB9_9HYPO|nr:alpha-N-arabinofuranosidase A [Stachybotrys elegans]